MPRNSSGVYSQPAGTAAVSGATASSSAFNELIDDIGDEITGSLPVDGSAGMAAPFLSVAGTVSLPGITFTGDPNTGFYHIGADSFGLTLGGTLRVTYATTGVTYAVPVNLPAKVTVASATTTDIGAAASNTISISGTTTITGLGTAAAGVERWLVFEGILTFTHNGTSLILPGAANITTAAGDVAHVKSEGSGNWRCYAYHRAATLPLAYASDAQAQAVTATTVAVTPANLAAMVATQANQETGTATDRFVTPGRQQFHASAAKAWAKADAAGASSASYNLTSITDNGTGSVTFTWATDFSSANYCPVGTIEIVSSTTVQAVSHFVDSGGVAPTVTATSMYCYRSNGAAATALDPTSWFLAAFGDQ